MIFAVCFGGLWRRLGAGPINLDMATPWLASAIEDNIGQGNTVEVGGTQIERAGRIRIAVRIRDIVVRDRDQRHRRERAEGRSEAVRHRAADRPAARREPQSRRCRTGGADHAGRHVTVSTGDKAKPLATGVASKRDAGLRADIPRARRAAPAAGRGGAVPTRPRADCSPGSTGSTA